MSVPGYEIERELGRGGFAVVYRAHQPKLRRTVALKVLTNVEPSDEDAKRRFEAECQAIGSLSWHPHVVTVYDAGATEDGLPFLAMEHLPAGSLQAKLSDHGKAPVSEVLRVTVQMGDALGAAHQAGILHRDIKPANVLTSRIGDYKLADFGIARFGDSQRTATGVITGTVAYSAPEVLRGSRASASSDLYALGAMLCAVASGRTPFVKDADESVVAIMYRVNTEDSPSLAEHGVPDDVALLIHTLMDKDPEKRPASALEVAQWAQCLQEQRGIAVAPLHTDPDLDPALPPAALAAGAGALAASAGPATPDSGPPSSAPPVPTPPPRPASTPAPLATPPPAYGTPPPGSYPTPPPAPAPATGGVPQPSHAAVAPSTAGYDPQTTGYGSPSSGYGAPPAAYPPSGPPTAGGGTGGGGGGKIVAIVAVVALVAVLLIVALAAWLGSGDSSATRTTAAPDRTTTETDSTAATSADTTESTSTSSASSTTTTSTSSASSTTTPTTTTTTTTTTGTTATTTGTTTAGGSADDYPTAERQTFLDQCTTSGGTTETCTCAIEELEQRYTIEEFRALDAQLRADPDNVPEDFTEIIIGCL